MTSAPRPGWYPDPGGRTDVFRWWDGEEWTDHVGDEPHAPEPPASRTATTRPSPARRVLALVLVLALVASAGVGVGLWLWRDDDSTGQARPGGPAPSSASGSTTGPNGRLDQRSRTATIAQASMVLPDRPYVLRDDPWLVSGLVGGGFLAEAPVHPAYADGQSWSALVGLVWLDPAVVGPSVDASTNAAVTRMAQLLYGRTATRVTDLEVDARSVDGYSAMWGTAKVHYTVKGLPSRYDVVAVHVVRLDGAVVAALMSVPDDADDAVLAQAEASLATLQVG